MRQKETLDRESWEACLEALEAMDGDTATQLRQELAGWDQGDSCSHVELTTDSAGRLDSESSPRPAQRYVVLARAGTIQRFCVPTDLDEARRIAAGLREAGRSDAIVAPG